MRRASPFLLPGGSAAQRGVVLAAWQRLSLPARGMLRRTHTRGVLLAQDAPFYCLGGNVPDHGGFAFYAPEIKRVVVAPDRESGRISKGFVLRALGSALDYASVTGARYATDAPAYQTHAGSLVEHTSAELPRDHFAYCFGLWHANREALQQVDATTCAIIDHIMREGEWPTGMLTWPNLTTQRQLI